jgi:hypothetical protein
MFDSNNMRPQQFNTRTTATVMVTVNLLKYSCYRGRRAQPLPPQYLDSYVDLFRAQHPGH